MTGPDRTQLELVEQYRQLAESYQALDAKIDSLIMANRKSRDKMSAEDIRRYRDWARHRSEILNDMRILEQQLDLAGDDAADAE